MLIVSVFGCQVDDERAIGRESLILSGVMSGQAQFKTYMTIIPVDLVVYLKLR